MTVDFDDFGANHIISNECQSHDCRDKLDALHYVNNNFKVTLFAIPGEMTPELLDWCKANNGWVELAVHGLFHRDNWECAQMSEEEFHAKISRFGFIQDYFVKGFKAPGWQISDGIYSWLEKSGWWVADQSYNNERRPKGMRAYVNNNGVFTSGETIIDAWHGHTWDCVGNGIYETYDHVAGLIKDVEEFKFVSEVV